MVPSKSDLYPLLFKPVLKDYVWGGRNLETLFGRDLPSGIVAESWEIAAHRDGTSTTLNGKLAGKNLVELHRDYGLALIGSNSLWAQERNRFPLLVKLLDAQHRLSVQVHPGDSYALENEDDELGKSEMWVVLHAIEGAELILGVAKGTNPDNFKQAILSDDLGPHLHRLQVTAGDFICVPSGSLHALLGGIVLAEIQQNSNATYRVYDWGRDSPSRPLHIDKAMAVINFDQVEPAIPRPVPLPSTNGIDRERLCHGRYFTVERWILNNGASFSNRLDGSTFEIWGCLDGQAAVIHDGYRLELDAVKFVLLPAALDSYRIQAASTATLLRVFVE